MRALAPNSYVWQCSTVAMAAVGVVLSVDPETSSTRCYIRSAEAGERSGNHRADL